MKNLYFLFVLCTLPVLLFCQNKPSTSDRPLGFPDKFFNAVHNKTEKVQQSIAGSSKNALEKLYRQELKIKRKLMRKDSTAAKRIFGNVVHRYDSIRKGLQNPSVRYLGVYSGRIDSMRTSLNFLQSNDILAASSDSKLSAALSDYEGVQKQLDQANFIGEQIKTRQEELRTRLSDFGLTKDLKKYQETIHRYRAQVEGYRNIFEEPQKLEAAVLQMVKKFPSFNHFFNKYSQIGQLFQLPGSDLAELPLSPGMQNRATINENLQERVGTVQNVQSPLSANMDVTKSALDRLKNRVNQGAGSDNDLSMPDYKGNKEKFKPLWKRLELGTNVQNNRSNSFFPTTTDFGLSIGFKASSKWIFGVGGSYRMGWGKNWRKITITHEGVGTRTFADWKLKGGFWLTGGWEMNHLAGFENIDALKESNAWQTSALTGLNKKFQFSKKTKAEIKLMYDFLWQRHRPTGHPLVFRMGYTLK